MEAKIDQRFFLNYYFTPFSAQFLRILLKEGKYLKILLYLKKDNPICSKIEHL